MRKKEGNDRAPTSKRFGGGANQNAGGAPIKLPTAEAPKDEGRVRGPGRLTSYLRLERGRRERGDFGKTLETRDEMERFYK